MNEMISLLGMRAAAGLFLGAVIGLCVVLSSLTTSTPAERQPFTGKVFRLTARLDYDTGCVRVLVQNMSEKAAYLWDHCCSDEYYCLTVEIKDRQSGSLYCLSRGCSTWTFNPKGCRDIQPGKTETLYIDITNNWLAPEGLAALRGQNVMCRIWLHAPLWDFYKPQFVLNDEDEFVNEEQDAKDERPTTAFFKTPWYDCYVPDAWAGLPTR